MIKTPRNYNCYRDGVYHPGKKILIGLFEGFPSAVDVWDGSNMKTVRSFVCEKGGRGNQLAVTSDWSVVATMEDQAIYLWDLHGLLEMKEPIPTKKHDVMEVP